MHLPPARRRRWPLRLLGLIATLALLGSGVAIAYMVGVIPVPADEIETPAAATGGGAAVKTGTSKPGLTAAQKVSRRRAVATLSEQGFEPVKLSDWRAENQLRVLIGRDEAGAERAFFFVGRRFVGNDDVAASAALKVTTARDKSVTLGYRLYEPTDQDCCPKGETVKVAFRWSDGKLVPAGELPPAAERVR